MRWTQPMAEAIVKLRALYLSSNFERYWEFQSNRIRADSTLPLGPSFQSSRTQTNSSPGNNGGRSQGRRLFW